MYDDILPVVHYPQKEVGECLAVCSLMVLAYAGIHTSLALIHNLLGVKWFGTPFSSVKALEYLGVKVEVKEGTLTELQDALLNNQPPIVGVDTKELSYTDLETQHAVVLVGWVDGMVFLLDPLMPEQPIAVSEDEFALAWLEHDYMFATIDK